MADVPYKIGVALATQSDYATVNPTLDPLDTVDETGGTILGSPSAGTFESGITPPQLVREAVERAPLSGALTMAPNMFVSEDWQTMQIAFPILGNGAVATPSSGEGVPYPGIDALFQGAGLIGTNGAAPDEDYKPSGLTKYITVKYWNGDNSWVFGGCLVQRLTFPFTGAQFSVVVADIMIGYMNTFDAAASPVLTYGNQGTLSPPVLKGSGFAFGQTVDFTELELVVENSILVVPRSNETRRGKIPIIEKQMFRVSGTVYSASADSDFNYQEGATAIQSGADMSWRIGDAAGATDIINGMNFALTNLDTETYEPTEVGRQAGATFAAKATNLVANAEATLTFD